MKRFSRILLYILLGLTGACLLAVTISAASNLFLPEVPTTLERLEALDQARLAEAMQLRRVLGDSAWPGLGSADIPMMVWNEEYSFLAGGEAAPPGWEALQANDGTTYYRQESDDPQNFAVPVGDGWAASLATKSGMDTFMAQLFRDALPPVIKSIFPYRLLIQPSEVQICGLVHEAMHVLQQLEAPKRLAEAEAAHRQGEAYWQADEAMRDSWEKEINLLYRAVNAATEAQALELARQFLDERQARREAVRLPEDLINYERQLEWEEGLAKYIELAIWQAAYEHTGYIPVLIDDPDFKAYRTFPSRYKQELDQMHRQAGQEGETRFYYTGMAQAILLDRLQRGWKEGAFQEGVWLEDLLP